MVGKRYFEQQDDDDEVESSEPEPTPAKKPKKAHQTDRDVDNADGQAQALSLTTLHLTRLPPTLTSESLTKLVSTLAPIKSAFVVPSNLPSGEKKSRGFGYVKFVLREDAERAVKELDGLLVEGRRISADWARRRERQVRGEKVETVENEERIRKRQEVIKRKERKEETKTRILPKDVNAVRTVVVQGLDAPGPRKAGNEEDEESGDGEGGEESKLSDSNIKKALYKKIKKLLPPANVSEGEQISVDWPVEDKSGRVAYIHCPSPYLSAILSTKLHDHVFKSRFVTCALKSLRDAVGRLGKDKGGGRILVRNLGFNVTELDLRSTFAPFGPMHSIDIPTEAPKANAEGSDPSKSAPSEKRNRGFAFIWFLRRSDAEKAIEKINGSRIWAGVGMDRISKGVEGKGKKGKATKGEEVKVEDEGKGRIVAVDWALAKDKWKEAQGDESKEAGKVESDLDEDEDEDEGDEEDSDLSPVEMGDEDEDEDEDEDLEPVAMGPEDEDGDEMDEDEIEDKGKKEETGTTLFVRNITFEVTEDELYNLFKSFGPLRYARIVMDPTTGRSRGTGFVCFWREDDAEAVLREFAKIAPQEIVDDKKKSAKAQKQQQHVSVLTADPSSALASSLSLRGRVVAVSRAVSKNEADKLREDRDKTSKTDRRNLYLMREGVVFPKSYEAGALHPTDLQARQDSFDARKNLLRSNPTLFISRTRLSIRQIPLYVSDAILRKLANWAVKEFQKEVKDGSRKALTKEELEDTPGDVLGAPSSTTASAKSSKKLKSRVRQAKVLRQADRVDAWTGLGRSKGYGFVEFGTHADALRFLRWSNANAAVIPLLKGWWKEELTVMINTLEGKVAEEEEKPKPKGKNSGGVAEEGGSDKAARLERLKEKLEELEKEERKSGGKDVGKKGGRGDRDGGDKMSRSSRLLLVEFSIENATVIKRRNEKVDRMRERVRKLKSGDDADGEEEWEGVQEVEQRENEPKKGKREGKRKRGADDAATGGRNPKKRAVGKENAPDQPKEDEEPAKEGMRIGSIIGKKRKQRKQKGGR